MNANKTLEPAPDTAEWICLGCNSIYEDDYQAFCCCHARGIPELERVLTHGPDGERLCTRHAREAWEEELSTTEIADISGVSPPTILRWMDKHGIERRESDWKVTGEDTRYRDPEWLATEYEDKGRTVESMADECGVDVSTVLRWMDKYEIDRRVIEGRNQWNWKERACFTWQDGYPVVSGQYKGQQWGVRIHRLAAVAWFGYDKVVGTPIHHKNGVKWDNREENLIPLDPVAHGKVKDYE